MLKKELRIIYKNKRDNLSLEDIRALSANIGTNLLELLSQLKFKTVNCFLSSDARKEVITNYIIETIRELGAEITVPVSNYETNRITAAQFKKGDQLIDDKFGIPTPTNICAIKPSTIDVVIVPLLCFDRKGYRCGYGKGMYDRFLSECKPGVVTIGLSFFSASTNISDIHEKDMPLNYIVSHQKTIRFN